MTTDLAEIRNCFQGVIPSIIATCGNEGVPNVTYISHVHFVDRRHVALSRQFFNKTTRNIDQNPRATVIVYDPIEFEAYRLRLRFDHSEGEGTLFERMSLRIDVIASHTGMGGVFKLISADVYEVLSVERIEGFLAPAGPEPEGHQDTTSVAGPLTELRGLQAISERVARAKELDELITGALTTLDELLGFSHSMLLVPDEGGERLVTIASRGYGQAGIGAEVALGAGLIGTVAARRQLIRLGGLGAGLRYGRAIRDRAGQSAAASRVVPEIPLPGLPDAQSQLALPLIAGERLVGVLAIESRDPLAFDDWDEAFFQIVANQVALGIDRMQSMPSAT